MRTVNAKTLSLFYDAKEDRMLLMANKDMEVPVAYWITRRLYFSILFELDGYLDKLALKETLNKADITVSTQKKTANSTNSTVGTERMEETESEKEKKIQQQKKIDASIAKAQLLQNVNVSMTGDKHFFVLRFRSSKIECVSKMNRKDFIAYYNLMKSSFPKNEWGII
jgi:hypothetical protein